MNKFEIVQVIKDFLSEGDEEGNELCTRAHCVLEFLEQGPHKSNHDERELGRREGREEYKAYIISELRNRADTKVNALPTERQAWRTVARWIEEGSP